MKKIFYLALVAVIMVACGQSQEQKAEVLIKESLKKTLYKPETYKPVETKVDLMMTLLSLKNWQS